jgi:hydrogenase maturation factor HypF (carbamoyltransferase family)
MAGCANSHSGSRRGGQASAILEREFLAGCIVKSPAPAVILPARLVTVGAAGFDHFEIPTSDEAEERPSRVSRLATCGDCCANTCTRRTTLPDPFRTARSGVPRYKH